MKSIQRLQLLFILVMIHCSSFAQEPVKLYFDGTYRRQAPDLKVMYSWLVQGSTTTWAEKNSNWVIEIDGGIYDNGDWHDILWHGQYSTPNPGYTLTIKPTLNDTVVIRGNNTVERALKIGSLTDGLIIEDIIFDGFYRTQILMYKSKNCIIRDCTFQNMNREGAWAAISIQDCEGDWGNNTITGNTFRNLNSPGIGLHAVYLTSSDNNSIYGNNIYYSSGGVFKCVDGSDYNSFDGNTSYDGCGDLAYFIGRNGTGQTTLSRGNAVTNTQCLISEGMQDSHVYDNTAYKYVRKFVYTSACCEYPEYEWPDNYEDQHDSTQAFYIPPNHTGNTFNQIRSDFDVDIDPIIDGNPAFIYLSSNPVGNADNPLYRGKYELNTEGQDLIITPDYYHLYDPYHQYLEKVKIHDLSRKPRAFTIDFLLRTCEGEAIHAGDLENMDGILDLEKWLIETTDASQWTTDIEGAGQLINISNSDSLLMELYTSDGSYISYGNYLDYLLLDGTSYKLFITGATQVTLRPAISTISISQHEHKIPGKIKLDQNYPNPFNPITTISYTLPDNSQVQLTIYDITGQTIHTLVDASRPAGSYNTQWNGMNELGRQVSTGVYFCRLQAGSFHQTIKMVYLP